MNVRLADQAVPLGRSCRTPSELRKMKIDGAGGVVSLGEPCAFS